MIALSSANKTLSPIDLRYSSLNKTCTNSCIAVHSIQTAILSVSLLIVVSAIQIAYIQKCYVYDCYAACIINTLHPVPTLCVLI